MRASCAGPLASHGEAEVGQGQPRAGQGGEQVVEPGLLAVEPVEGDLELFHVAEPGLLAGCGNPTGEVGLDAAQLLGGDGLDLQEVAADAGVLVAATAAEGADTVSQLDASPAEVLPERGELVRGRRPILLGWPFGPAVGEEPEAAL